MGCLHRHGILHRDLKTTNILVSCDGRMVKISDFGLSRFKCVVDKVNTVLDLVIVAPEVLYHQDYYTEKADVYSFALVLWELFSHRPPVCLGGDGTVCNIGKVWTRNLRCLECLLPSVLKACT